MTRAFIILWEHQQSCSNQIQFTEIFHRIEGKMAEMLYAIARVALYIQMYAYEQRTHQIKVEKLFTTFN